MSEFLKIRDLHVEYTSGGQIVKAVNGVDVTLDKGVITRPLPGSARDDARRQ